MSSFLCPVHGKATIIEGKTLRLGSRIFYCKPEILAIEKPW